MRGRRVISLLLSLVMTLSLCSGVWATGEAGGDPASAKKTESDAGLAFTASNESENGTPTTKEMKFFDGMQDGYMEYKNSAAVGKAGDNKTPVVAASPVEVNRGVFVAFAYDGSIDGVANKDALIEIRNGSDESGNEIDNSEKVSVTYENSEDTALYVFRIVAKQDLGKGTNTWIDFALKLDENQIYPFVIDFGGYDGGNQQNSALGDFDRDDDTLIVKSVNNVGETIELPIDWRDDLGGKIQNIGLTAGVLNDLESFKKDVFVACRWGVRLTLPKDVIADMASNVTDDNKLWIVTDYRDGEGGSENTPDKAVAFRTQFYIGEDVGEGASKYALPNDQNYTFGMEFEKSSSDYVLYCPNENNTDLEVQDGVTVAKKEYSDSDMMCVSFSVGYDGDFVLAPSDYTFQRQWPWYGNQFAGVSEALKDAPDDAKKYGADYLNNDTGRLKCQNSDEGGILVKGSYTDTEKEAIKSAVRAFRAFRDGQHDDTLNALGNMGEIDFDGNGWNSYFGHYLAELASRVGISLWGDYPCWNGVKMTLDTDKTIFFYTECDYGIPAYDNSLGVEANATEKTYTIPYTQTYYCFAIPAGSGEVKSLTVKGATSTEVKDENNEVIGYNCQPFQDSDIEVQTRWDGWFGSDNNKTYLFSVQTSHDRLAYDLPLVITYSDQSTAEFNVKAVDPNPWKPNDTVIAKNATGVLRELYKNGFKAPAYGTNLHLYFPQQLHGYDATKAADYAAGTAHWDYKWSYDTNTGIVTIEVNSDHEDCWKNCVGTDTVLLDGVYFGYWIGGSDESKPAPYGIHLNFEPEGETPDCDYAILTEDYEYSNGWKMAVVNQRSTTSTVLTFKEGAVSYGEAVAMSNDKANNKQSASNAEYKYALQFNVVTDKTKAIKLDTEETQRVPKNRVSFSTVNGVETGKWKCEVPEDGKAFVLYSGDDYTEATAAGVQYGQNKFSNVIGLVSITVPAGYTTLNYVVDDYSENYISSYNNEYAPIDLETTGQAQVSFPVFKARYNSIKLIWSDNTGKTLTESLLVEMGNATPWMGLLEVDDIDSTPASAIMDEQTVAFLQENGITVTYNAELGYFSTSVDASKLKDLSALNYLAMLTPMEGAAFFKMYGFGGSESPFVHGEERKEQVKAWFDGENPISLTEVDGNDITMLSLIQIDTLTVNGLTVYFSETQLFRGVVIQWLDENENVLGYSYVYGRNGDFVTSVPTATTPEVIAPVDKPTLEGFDTDPGFTCDRNPQTGGNGSKVFFQFSVKNMNGIDKEHKAVIYLPYEYFGITPAEGMRRAARGEKPVIYHYLDESCANEKEIIYGEYTPFGVKFETGSFSPFVVDCSTTSTTHRYHTTTVTKADSPETFDGGIALYGALAVTSLTGMAYVGKKRED